MSTATRCVICDRDGAAPLTIVDHVTDVHIATLDPLCGNCLSSIAPDVQAAYVAYVAADADEPTSRRVLIERIGAALGKRAS